jgi:hypothetical protein
VTVRASEVSAACSTGGYACHRIDPLLPIAAVATAMHACHNTSLVALSAASHHAELASCWLTSAAIGKLGMALVLEYNFHLQALADVIGELRSRYVS